MLKIISNGLSNIRCPNSKISVFLCPHNFSVNFGKYSYSRETKKNFYEILKVDRKATPREIKTAYFKLSLQYHPDKTQHRKDELFREITEAYAVLGNATKRRIYDRGHFFPFDQAEAEEKYGNEKDPLITKKRAGSHEIDKIVRDITTNTMKLDKQLKDNMFEQMQDLETVSKNRKLMNHFFIISIPILILGFVFISLYDFTPQVTTENDNSK